MHANKFPHSGTSLCSVNQSFIVLGLDLSMSLSAFSEWLTLQMNR